MYGVPSNGNVMARLNADKTSSRRPRRSSDHGKIVNRAEK